MTGRAQQIEAFLTQAGWQDAERAPLPGDASARRYIRLSRDGMGAMLGDERLRSVQIEGGRSKNRRKALAEFLAPYGLVPSPDTHASSTKGTENMIYLRVDTDHSGGEQSPR